MVSSGIYVESVTGRSCAGRCALKIIHVLMSKGINLLARCVDCYAFLYLVQLFLGVCNA
jgi:hypothetical protein